MADTYSGAAFKRNLVNFVTGRAVNAVTSFAIFLWIAKVLPTDQYAIYIAAYSILEIMLIVSGLGMEWVTGRFLPVARAKASGRELNVLVLRCIGFQALCLLVGAAAFYALAPVLSTFLGIGNATEALRIYALVMWIEGITRLFRDQLLTILLLQGAAQTCQMLRNLTILGLAAAAFRNPEYCTSTVLAVLECIASGASAVVGGLFLAHSLYRTRGTARKEDWESPSWKAMLQVGRDAWIGNLASLTWSPQVVMLLVARSAGAEATALLGFAHNFAEYFRRYMPIELLLSVFRTFVVVHYARDRNVERLATVLGIGYKINLLFLLPFVAVMAVVGDDVLALVGHGEFGEARWLVFGWIVVTVSWAHRRIADMLAYTLDMSAVTRSVSLYLAVTPLVIYGCVWAFGWHSFYAVLVLAEIAYSTWVVRSVNRSMSAYAFDWSSMSKFAFALAVAIVVLRVADFGSSALHLTCSLIVAAVVEYGVLVLLRAWADSEAVFVREIRNKSSTKVVV